MAAEPCWPCVAGKHMWCSGGSCTCCGHRAHKEGATRGNGVAPRNPNPLHP